MAEIAKVKIDTRIYSVKDEEARRQISSEISSRMSSVAALQQSISSEESARTSADTALEASIEAEETRAKGVEQTLLLAIDGINGKIPAQATSQNQLADKEFVNDKVSTSTATFRGTHNSLAELEAVAADINDYGFVITTDADGNTLYKRYKHNGTNWVWEYDLNNSSFTAEQWAAIQSGITKGHVSRINNLGQLAFHDYAIGGVRPSGTNAPSVVTLQGGGKARLETKTLPVVSVPAGWAEQTSQASKITKWDAGTMFTAQVSGETLTLTPGAAPQLTYQDLSALIGITVRAYATVPRVESGAPITIATGAVSEDGTGAEVVTELPTGGTAAAQVFTGDFVGITVNAPNY